MDLVAQMLHVLHLEPGPTLELKTWLCLPFRINRTYSFLSRYDYSLSCVPRLHIKEDERRDISTHG
jgi:hypothetical protein